MSERQSPDKADVNKAMMYWHERAMAAERTRDELAEALRPFAAFQCSPPGTCQCNNCRARDILASLDAEKEPTDAR